jgi:hypothetical protein
MRTLRLRLRIVGIAMLFTATTCLSAQTFLPIDFPGATKTTAIGINDRGGDIVGGYLDSKNGVHVFFMSKGIATTIEVPTAVRTMGVNAINIDRQRSSSSMVR